MHHLTLLALHTRYPIDKVFARAKELGEHNFENIAKYIAVVSLVQNIRIDLVKNTIVRIE
jgi:hypothetical protein